MTPKVMQDKKNAKRVLIVSGNFDITSRVRQALNSGKFAIQTAYSHADGVYSFENEEFDIVLVDADMADHRSGESTVLLLAALKQAVPVVAVTEDISLAETQLPPNVSVSSPTEMAVVNTVHEALKLPLSPNDDSIQPFVENRPTDTTEIAATLSNSTEELRTLFALSKSLTEVLDLNAVLNRVVEAARRLTNAEEGMILLPGEDDKQLYLRAKVGIDLEVARNFRVKTEDTLAGHVYATGQPVLIGAQGPLKVKTEYLVNALLYVPIIYEGKCIGVLGVNNKTTEATFDPRYQDLLQNLASFAAIAIENARVHEEALERTRELQTLVEASQVLNSSLSLDTTLPNICEQLMQVVAANTTAIYERDRQANQLRLLAKTFRTIWAADQGPEIELAGRLVVQQALDKSTAPVISRRDASLPAGELEFLNQAGVDTLQIVPIVGGDQILGIAQFMFIQPPQRLPNAEVLQRIRHMTLEMLAMLSSQTSQTKPQGVFRIVENANQLLGADWCEIALMTPNRHSLMLSLAFGQGVWISPPYPYLDLSRAPDLVGLLDGQSIFTRQLDGKTATGIRLLFDHTGGRSLLGLPLIQRGVSQGIVLFADSRRNRAFTERDIDKARAIVAQSATALDNARLVDHLERSLVELKETQDRLVQTARLSAMGELAAAVAHQINNPLTTIVVDSEMMLADEAAGSKNTQSLEAIYRAGKRASGVARRLLAIARPNDPESPPEPINVKDTILGILSLVRAHIERDHIEVIEELPDGDLPPVLAVQGQLDDIWLNLLLNAHDALIGRESGKIGIKAAYLAGDQFIEVVAWDNGPGIPEAIVNEVFKPFFTTKPVGEGTGLGLHICRQTAERIGGSIVLVSAPGEGARFLVKLPVSRGGKDS
jgi:signal transduction histidine kinase